MRNLKRPKKQRPLGLSGLKRTYVEFMKSAHNQPEQNRDAAQLSHGREVLGMKFIPCDKTTEVSRPGKHPFDLPAAAVTPQWATVLRFGSFPPVRGDHFNTPIFIQFGVKFIAVISLVADHAFRQLAGKSTIQSVFNQVAS